MREAGRADDGGSKEEKKEKKNYDKEGREESEAKKTLKTYTTAIRITMRGREREGERRENVKTERHWDNGCGGI